MNSIKKYSALLLLALTTYFVVPNTANGNIDCDPWEVYVTCVNNAYAAYEDGMSSELLALFINDYCVEVGSHCL